MPDQISNFVYNNKENSYLKNIAYSSLFGGARIFFLDKIFNKFKPINLEDEFYKNKVMHAIEENKVKDIHIDPILLKKDINNEKLFQDPLHNINSIDNAAGNIQNCLKTLDNKVGENELVKEFLDLDQRRSLLLVKEKNINADFTFENMSRQLKK